MRDLYTRSLFEAAQDNAGSLACGIEIAATMKQALEQAQCRGLKRDQVAERMSYYLGERISKEVLDTYTAQSKPGHEINLRRAIAFDAALEDNALLELYARKRGDRKVITSEEAAYIELGRIHQEEKELAERKRALQVMLRSKK